MYLINSTLFLSSGDPFKRSHLLTSSGHLSESSLVPTAIRKGCLRLNKQNSWKCKIKEKRKKEKNLTGTPILQTSHFSNRAITCLSTRWQQIHINRCQSTEQFGCWAASPNTTGVYYVSSSGMIKTVLRRLRADVFISELRFIAH